MSMKNPFIFRALLQYPHVLTNTDKTVLSGLFTHFFTVRYFSLYQILLGENLLQPGHSAIKLEKLLKSEKILNSL